MSRGIGRREGEFWRRSGYGANVQSGNAPFASRLLYANYADRGIAIATGVAGWEDVVGNRDFVQATTTRQPAYGVFTSSPALVFDGTTDRMDAPATAAANVWTLAFTCVTSGGSKTIFETSAASGVGNPGSILIYENGGNLNFEYYRTGTTRKFYAVGAGQKLRIIVVLNPGANGADAWPLLYINGVSSGAYGVITGATGQIGSYTWSMGSLANATFFWGGKLGDVLTYGDALSVDEIGVLDAWMAGRSV